MHDEVVRGSSGDIAGLPVFLLGENLGDLPGKPSAHPLRALLHGRKKPVKPLVRDLVRHLVRVGSRRCAGPLRIDKRERAVKAHLPHQRERSLEILLRLPRKADDDVGGEGNIRHGRAELLHQTQIMRPVIVPVHFLKKPVAPGLHRKMQMRAELFFLRHRPDQVVREILRVRGHEAYPLYALHTADPAQESGKGGRLGEFFPVGIDVLPEQHDLLHAVRGQMADLREDILRLAADLAAADIGNNAVGAEIIAPVHDVHAGFEAVLPLHRQGLRQNRRLFLNLEDPLFLREGAVQKLRKRVEVVGSEHKVHEGIALFDLLHRVRLLHEAAAEPDDPARVAFPVPAKTPQPPVDMLVRVIPDGTGIVKDKIRLIFLPRVGKSRLPQDSAKLFGVPRVHLAAEGLNIGSRHVTKALGVRRRRAPRLLKKFHLPGCFLGRFHLSLLIFTGYPQNTKRYKSLRAKHSP